MLSFDREPVKEGKLSRGARRVTIRHKGALKKLPSGYKLFGPIYSIDINTTVYIPVLSGAQLNGEFLHANMEGQGIMCGKDHSSFFSF